MLIILNCCDAYWIYDGNQEILFLFRFWWGNLSNIISHSQNMGSKTSTGTTNVSFDQSNYLQQLLIIKSLMA